MTMLTIVLVFSIFVIALNNKKGVKEKSWF